MTPGMLSNGYVNPKCLKYSINDLVNISTDSRQAASNASALKADPKKGFIVGGISAGANFTAVVSHLARDEHLSPPLTGLYLSVPALVDPSSMPAKYNHEFLSREQNKNAPILGQDSMDMFIGSYLRNLSHSPLLMVR